jgi:hypothetical protein
MRAMLRLVIVKTCDNQAVFSILFMEVLQNIALLFDECDQTCDLHKGIRQPSLSNTVQIIDLNLLKSNKWSSCLKPMFSSPASGTGLSLVRVKACACFLSWIEGLL